LNGFTKVTGALQYLKILGYKLKSLFYSAICIQFVTSLTSQSMDYEELKFYKNIYE